MVEEFQIEGIICTGGLCRLRTTSYMGLKRRSFQYLPHSQQLECWVFLGLLNDFSKSCIIYPQRYSTWKGTQIGRVYYFFIAITNNISNHIFCLVFFMILGDIFMTCYMGSPWASMGTSRIKPLLLVKSPNADSLGVPEIYRNTRSSLVRDSPLPDYIVVSIFLHHTTSWLKEIGR